ncbi:MAG: HAD-IC family P-type ATPase, partial [Chitinophagaceae bacterium]
GPKARLYFHQQPQDKLAYIRALEKEGNKVMMIGDGLNDAGALKESTVGIAVSENTNNFTPASDAILEASRLSYLPRYIRLCQNNRQIVLFSFLLSIVYNVVGLSFALQGMLSPVVAAILMPISSITIVLVTFGTSTFLARRLGL